jgi:hypothetical protein
VLDAFQFLHEKSGLRRVLFVQRFDCGHQIEEGQGERKGNSVQDIAAGWTTVLIRWYVGDSLREYLLVDCFVHLFP